MTFFQIKALLAVLLVAAGLTAALSMLTLMGRTERRLGVIALLRTHRAAGYVFVCALLVLAVMGVRYLSAVGDTLPLRGVLHWVLASLLVFLLALKLAIVRFFKQFIKYVPVMGMTVIVLALLVAAVSLGFFLVTQGTTRTTEVTEVEETAASPLEENPGEAAAEEAYAPTAEAGTTDEPVAEAPVDEPAGTSVERTAEAPEEPRTTKTVAAPVPQAAPGNATAGKDVFAINCSSCHNADSAAAKIGPGLAGLFDREKLGASGKPVTLENVRGQIVNPARSMPSFKSYLSDEELDNVTAYLRTL